jgi:hypothetical protein
MAKDYEQNNQEDDGILDDDVLVPVLQTHPDEAKSLIVRSEQIEDHVDTIQVEPLGLIESAVLSYNKHRKGVKRVLGGLSIGTGFIVGGAVAAHHRR